MFVLEHFQRLMCRILECQFDVLSMLDILVFGNIPSVHGHHIREELGGLVKADVLLNRLE